MEDIKKIPFVSSEIAGLWSCYMSETLSKCILSYFINHVEDDETRSLLKETMDKSVQHISILTDFFNQAEMPLPHGFTEKDVDVNAPRLFTDGFYPAYLSFVARIGMCNYTLILNQISRVDLIDYFTDRVKDAMELYKKSAILRLSKGIFIKTPQVEVSKEVKFIESYDFFSDFFGERRPMILREVTHVFANIFSNIIGKSIVTAFGQVSKNKEVSKYFFEGKDLAQEIINELTELYIKEDIPISSASDSYVTASTVSPFSDRLMMNHVLILASTGISNAGSAMAESARSDLLARHMKNMTRAIKYSNKGARILIDNKWLEQPPQVINHEKLAKV